MAELKTKPTDADVHKFLAGIADEQQRKDSEALCQFFQDVTGEPPKMWGSSIIGFGSFHYKYKSGREGDWMLTGFSPRKGKLTLYFMDGYGQYQPQLAKLGKHSTAKSCLYIKRLSDVDLTVLRDIAKQSVKRVRSGELFL